MRRSICSAVIGAMLLSLSVVPAAADGHQVQILSPISGSVTSAPGEHWTPYGGDWAMDIAAGGGTAVHARFAHATGNLSLSIEHVGDACGAGREGGEQVRLRVHAGGADLGYVVYSHLTNIPQRSGAVSNNQRLGDLAANLPVDSDCWTGPHVHLEPYNQRNYSCFVPRSTGAGVSPSTVVGVLGGAWADDGNQACPSEALNDPVSPEASVSPTSGDQDTTFEGTASGFTPSSSVTQTVYEPDGSPHPTSRYTQNRTTDASGSFTWLWYWDSGDPFGEYEIHFRDDSSGQEITVSFTINAPDPDPEPDPDPFVDVSTTHTHYEAITWIADREIALGFADGTYRPNRSVARGQMASFLARALDLPVPTGGAGFTDVPPGSTHADAIASIHAAEITTGYPDGTFRPNQPVTRGQMAAFLTRALGLPSAQETFPDVPADHVHGDSISRVAGAGIAEGFSDGTYRPQDDVLRGQMAAFLFRALQ